MEGKILILSNIMIVFKVFTGWSVYCILYYLLIIKICKHTEIYNGDL